MEGNESAFIVFRKTNKVTEKKDNFPQKAIVYKIDTPWKITFEAGKRGPKTPVVWSQLKDWMDSENDSIKYFPDRLFMKLLSHWKNFRRRACILIWGM